MPTEVILPKVDMDMEAGTLAAWYAGAGDRVEKGAALFDIETDKAAMEVEAPATGILAHILADIGARVPVGEVIAWIYGEDEAIPVEPPGGLPARPPGGPVAAEAALPAREEAPATPARAAEPPGTSPALRPRATPAARAAARSVGLVLDTIAGSGPRGRVQRDDVPREAWVPAPEPAGPRGWSAQPGPLAVTRTKGGAGTPLVLFHGFAADSRSWQALMRALPPGRDILRIDLPSHGASPRRQVSGFAKLARMAVEAFDALSLDRAHLVGHSLGGAIAAAVADIRPRRIATVGLIAPAGLGAEIDGAALEGIARATQAESLGPWLQRMGAEDGRFSEEYVRAAMQARRDPAMRAAQADLAQLLFPDSTQGFDLVPALARIEAPLAVIWGRRDRILPWRHALRLPGWAALHLLPQAGHVPHLEDAETVAKLLSRLFLTGET